MPVGLCELIPFERLRKWRRNVSEASPYLWPIFISMMLTQIIWVGVYQCSDKDNIVKQTRYMAGDQSLSIRNNSKKFDFEPDRNPKTSRDYIIESLQFVAISVVVIVIGSLVEWFASKFKKGEECSDEFFALYMSSYCAGYVVRDATNLLDIDQSLKQLVALAMSTEFFPARVTKYFGLTNRVFFSVVLLNLLPGGSLWIIIAALLFFVGLTHCISPKVRRGTDHARIYGNPQKSVPVETKDIHADYRRFNIYEVKVRQTPDGYARAQIETTQSNKSIVEVGEIMYSEFLACGIIVGQAMASGIIPGIVSACCVLIGVVCSVNVKNRKKLVDRSPYGELFGLCGHFGTLLVQYALIFLFKTTV